MTTQILNGTGNLSNGSVFGAAETGASALAMVRANTTTLGSNANVSSPSFTVTSGKVIDGVLLWLMANQASPAGTLTVELDKSGASQASVTVNVADLPHSATGTNDVLAVVPVFFKFTSTATGDGTANWTIKLTTSNVSGAQITYSRNSATAGDFTRALRTTTSSNPAAADDLYVVGELTGAGTHNAHTCTMDLTSSSITQFGNGTVNSTAANGGGVRISAYGSLTFGNSASTNYYLQVKGDVEVYWNGELDVGIAGGSEIPRTSSAVLELVMNAASGDFGLQAHNLSTVNIAGLSRTSGKNVVQTKLTADVTGSDVLTSGPTANNGTITANNAADPTGISLLASTFTDNATASATHSAACSGPSITNTTQVAIGWFQQGTGTHNRFVRFGVGNNAAWASVTNGFYTDLDLQAGTAGTATALGNGTATSASIQAVGSGWFVILIGKVSSGAATPTVHAVSCSAAGTTSYTGDTTQCFRFENIALLTASSLSDTTFNVADDTGWLSGDAICVASTTRTYQDSEDFVLSANAGASSMTSHLYPFGHGGPTSSVASTHNGTSPVQAEVGLLTRNVKIRSSSTSLWGYIYREPLASITFSWAEFYYLGSNAANKHGIELAALSSGNATANSITYCSIHDVDYGIYMASSVSSSINLTFSNNVIWNTLNHAVIINSTITATDWTFDSNLVMKVSGVGFNLGDVGGTLTNNSVVSTSSNGILETEGAYGLALGTRSGNTVHSCNSSGLALASQGLEGTISNFKSYRNTIGIAVTGLNVGASLTISNPTIFGNSNSNISLTTGWLDVLNISGGVIAGDTTFSSTIGILFNGANSAALNLSNVDFSGTTSIYQPHTTSEIDYSSSSKNVAASGTLNNCKFGAPAVIGSTGGGKTVWSDASYLSFEKYSQTAGDHRTEMTYGTLKTDSTIYDSASPSMRMTPSSSSKKLESAPKGRGMLVAVANGSAATVSAYIRKSVSGDGAAYNGNQPRLIQRANPALGQNSDVVLATYSSAAGSWNQLSASTSSPTDDGAFEIIVDCDGTAGWVNVDDLAAA